MSLRITNELGRIAEMVNSRASSSSIEFFFGRGELSQVVTRPPLSQLIEARASRLSARGPGGFENRKARGLRSSRVTFAYYARIARSKRLKAEHRLIASLSIIPT